jgi:pimeloyl-ACP methyl ester carboxylesterase
MPAHIRDQLLLADGRRLVFAITGPDDGAPVIYCHGAIGTPLGPSVDLETITCDLGVRYVAVSRPGIGGSDQAPGRTVLDFADDLRQLADALDLLRFAVVGVSAGGPYALAVGRRLSDRISGLAVCSSLSPLGRSPGMALRARLAPRHRRQCRARRAAAAADHRRARRRQRELPRRRRRGVTGMIDDYLTCLRPWGFAPHEVPAEVHLWHGARDPLVPPRARPSASDRATALSGVLRPRRGPPLLPPAAATDPVSARRASAGTWCRWRFASDVRK